ncbi:MAG: response regulator transcription factor [Thermodesulfobacteriota bacterium]|nr:response regulator transcription factor [Thermodesulfobacteriota bacterium]
MLRTLMIEDNDIFRKTLKRILTSKFPSMQIEEAVDGKEAFSKIEVQPPEIIFMDINLPGENGIQLSRRIKEFHPHISIVIITSYDSPEYREAAYESGADRFISKNKSSIKEIAETVASLLILEPDPH